VTDRLPRTVVLPLIGHLGLVLAIIADFYRRSTGGGISMLLAAVCLVALLVGGILFVRHPRLFFFGLEPSTQPPGRPKTALRVLAWALVVATPVLWLIAVDQLPSLIPSEWVMRLVAAYVFFAWVATAIIVSPHLFSRHQ